MNHAEAVQNEKMLGGAFACEVAGNGAGSDLVLVLCWCSPVVLLWIYFNTREKRISLKAGTCRAGGAGVVLRLLQRGRSTSACSPACRRAVELGTYVLP